MMFLNIMMGLVQTTKDLKGDGKETILLIQMEVLTT